MEPSKFSDRMATDILSAFVPLNEPPFAFTNGVTEEEEEEGVLPAPPSSDHQRAVKRQLNGHIATEQDLRGKKGIANASDGGKDVMVHSAQSSSLDAMRSTEEGSQAGQTWSRDSLEESPAPRDCEQPGDLEAAHDHEEGRIVTTLAPKPDRPKSAEQNKVKPKEHTKALQFHPLHSVRSYEQEEPSPTAVNGKGDDRCIRNDRGSVMGHANLVKKHLDFFAKLPEKQRLSPRVRRLMEEEAPNEDERRKGKIVIYMTSLTAVRETYSQCCTLLEIIHNHNVRYQTKDIYLHPKYKKELKERLQSRRVTVPQMFINGEHIGDDKVVLGLNETGQLQRKLIGFEKEEGEGPCQTCEGRGFVPCLWCRGTKKGTKNRWGALECTVCNQNGLQHCPDCSDMYKAKKRK